jgi:DNA-binding beta-propeller fold protein YncE
VHAYRPSDIRRGLLAGGLAIIIIIVVPIGSPETYARSAAGAKGPLTAAYEHGLSGSSDLNVYVVPKAPGPMAIGPNGNLYIADDTRDQILERLSNGRFVVVAGDGKRGSSGDGGPAVKAELDGPGGMAFSPAGALYFADIGNNEVRRFVPGGNISTVAGAPGRWTGPLVNGEAALHAHLLSPTDVAFGPSGEVYIADTGDNEVLRVGRDDKLDLVAGDPHIRAEGIANMGMPATKASPDGPAGIAFNRTGDLFIFGSNTKALLMIGPNGIIHALIGQQPMTGFFPHSAGGLVTAPDGQVFGLDAQSLYRLTTTGARNVVDFITDALTRDWSGFLPNGIAVAANGSIYVDTDGASGYTQTPGIVKIRQDGAGHVIWQG